MSDRLSVPESDRRDAADGAPTPAADAPPLLDPHWSSVLARLTGGPSPATLVSALGDWAARAAAQPSELTTIALRAWTERGQSPVPEDPRFGDPAWKVWPWSALLDGYRQSSAFCSEAMALPGVAPHHREVLRFCAQQWLDLMAPSNWGLGNPQVLKRTVERRGTNLVAGGAKAVEQWRRATGLGAGAPGATAFRPGIEVAVTPGAVVYRNALVELIQYTPRTAKVHAEPVFIVPSWIMKYYVLDLSPHNSMVNWLVGQGHTVFMLSWRNPDETDALLDMTDYLELGVLDSLAQIGRRCPGQRVHAAGYCLGGTLLAIAAAALARRAQRKALAALPALASVTLLAAQTDFSEPGEIGVLIDAAQVTLLEDLMAEKGYLSGRQMAASFTYLHARDLVWSRAVHELWLDDPISINDLMAWNADTTRLPAVMHSEYLNRCFLRNELALGRYPVHGRPVSLRDIRCPLFVVATEKDHVSPWRSVYKLHGLCRAPLTFVLASGGHNAGIVSEPGHPGRHFALHQRGAWGATYDADAWRAQATSQTGSWWPAWGAWLIEQGSGRMVPARAIGSANALEAAPGSYVLTRYDD